MARQLFSDAPVLPAVAPAMPTPGGSSGLAAALLGRGGNFSLPTPSLGVPLSAMMQMMQNRGQGPQPTAEALLGAPSQQGTAPGAPPGAPWTQSQGVTAPPSWLSQIAPDMPGQISATNPNAGTMPLDAQGGMGLLGRLFGRGG